MKVKWTTKKTMDKKGEIREPESVSDERMEMHATKRAQTRNKTGRKTMNSLVKRRERWRGERCRDEMTM
ncbi:hypothetical protein M419DRAFT_134634 [Trichoderma reesei RUT C-30]|uniref:Uncharacterized protein n=1 Tax=Hypocrea jecorina (strain ATCC 56765 / BCRC 32924 / NRRL 11460 / Rut C-30) TaxID=1344414 RepID=A0A024RW13_HYPJR|nr:hypothetical protein M419DRAFT_134634 [Trichoderma reesei RUT C-30]